MRSKDIETLESNFWAKANVWLFCMQVGKWGFDWQLWFSVSGQIKGWRLSPGDGWIVLSFLSALKNPSMVVLDNASYHNVKTEDKCVQILVRKKLFSKTILHNTTFPFLLPIPKKSIIWKNKTKTRGSQEPVSFTW